MGFKIRLFDFRENCCVNFMYIILVIIFWVFVMFRYFVKYLCVCFYVIFIDSIFSRNFFWIIVLLEI